jgi:hypothetical protein
MERSGTENYPVELSTLKSKMGAFVCTQCKSTFRHRSSLSRHLQFYCHKREENVIKQDVCIEKKSEPHVTPTESSSIIDNLQTQIDVQTQIIAALMNKLLKQDSRYSIPQSIHIHYQDSVNIDTEPLSMNI